MKTKDNLEDKKTDSEFWWSYPDLERILGVFLLFDLVCEKDIAQNDSFWAISLNVH